MIRNHNYLPEEFIVSHLNCGDARWALEIVHQPSGISKISPVYSLNDTANPSSRKLHLLLIDELIAELQAKGIEPQKPRVGVKKVGKPRWDEAEKKS
jgi:hypothetical protein